MEPWKNRPFLTMSSASVTTTSGTTIAAGVVGEWTYFKMLSREA